MKTKFCLILLLASLIIYGCKKDKVVSEDVFIDYSKIKIPDFNADSAYNFVKRQCDFGPRIPFSSQKDECQKWIVSYLRTMADTVYVQDFETSLYDGRKLVGHNIIASFNSSASERVLFASHWDSRLWADNDSDKSLWQKPISGANDGASGVGVLMEIARLLKGKSIKQGLDLVLFDLEDQGSPQWADTLIEDQTDWCLGSQYWAQNLHIPYYRAKYGILLDMVGGKGICFTKEQQSMQYAPSIMNNVWQAAKDLGYDKYFLDRSGTSVMDDHIWVNHYANIPMIDIVNNEPNCSFFPYWHTTKDDISCISKQSLSIVGKVLLAMFFSGE